MSIFPISSRYHGIEIAQGEFTAGSPVAYLRRRFVPSPDQFTALRSYTVVEGDRLDNLSARFLGDPEQFWQLCDANGAMVPRELEELGRQLAISVPDGLQGAAL